MLSLLLILAAAGAGARFFASAPSELRSLDGTGYSPWTNLDDARCSTPRAAAAECYARSDTRVLEARGFDFATTSEVAWLEARWIASVEPVPLDGWILTQLQMRWNDGASVLDLSSPNHTSRDESVLLRMRVSGSADWRNVSLRVAFASTNEDATFLISCVELRAGFDGGDASGGGGGGATEPPSTDVEPLAIAAGASVALGIFVVARRVRSARARKVRRRDDDFELVAIAPRLFLEELRFADPPGISPQRCETRSGAPAIACRLRGDDSRDRFAGLRVARHANLASFLGLYDGGARGVFAVWSGYEARVDVWRKEREPCAALGLRIAQAAACALHALSRHLYVHGDVACRNLVIEDDGRIALTGAGLERARGLRERSEADDPILRWMAPEAVRGGPLDLATDRWSLGVLIWEACSDPDDAEPFARFDARAFAEVPPEDLTLERPPHATPAIWAVAEACLRPNRDARASVESARDDLLAVTESTGARPDARDRERLVLLDRRTGALEAQTHVE